MFAIDNGARRVHYGAMNGVQIQLRGGRVGNHDAGDLLVCQCTPVQHSVLETAKTVHIRYDKFG